MPNKFTFSRLSTLINAPAAINGIITQIESALNSFLSRDGTSPNQMTSALDMNSNRLLNLPYPTTNLEPIRVRDFSAILAATAYPNLDSTWVWQVKEALRDHSQLDVVESAISPITTNSINMFWTMGGITSVGDTLSLFIQSTLGWSSAQMETLYGEAKIKTR